MDIEKLDIYYEDCVIGGPGAFVIPIREREQFNEATRTKLVLEIAGRTPERARHAGVSATRRAFPAPSAKDVAAALGPESSIQLSLEPRRPAPHALNSGTGRPA